MQKQNRKALAFFATVAVIAALSASGPAMADASGSWTRPNGDTVQVTESGGRLYCKIVKGAQPGFEMCHGMAKSGGSTWKGGNMKHPDMPGFMTFNGTVTNSGSSLRIKGCAVGESMCDAESWSRAK